MWGGTIMKLFVHHIANNSFEPYSEVFAKITSISLDMPPEQQWISSRSFLYSTQIRSFHPRGNFFFLVLLEYGTTERIHKVYLLFEPIYYHLKH